MKLELNEQEYKLIKTAVGFAYSHLQDDDTDYSRNPAFQACVEGLRKESEALLTKLENAEGRDIEKIVCPIPHNRHTAPSFRREDKEGEGYCNVCGTAWPEGTNEFPEAEQNPDSISAEDTHPEIGAFHRHHE